MLFGVEGVLKRYSLPKALPSLILLSVWQDGKMELSFLLLWLKKSKTPVYKAQDSGRPHNLALHMAKDIRHPPVLLY